MCCFAQHHHWQLGAMKMLALHALGDRTHFYLCHVTHNGQGKAGIFMTQNLQQFPAMKITALLAHAIRNPLYLCHVT
jgi:hypothetical protein